MGNSGHRGDEKPERLWPMGAVSRLTGLSEHTLRAWEKRFGFPAPVRLDSGHRRYPVEQVRRLSAIQAALARGHRVGDLIGLDEAAIDALLTTPPDSTPQPSSVSSLSYLDLCLQLETETLAIRLRADAAALGVTRFLAEKLIPFIAAIGDGWQKGTLAIRHEHAATEIIDGVLRELRTPRERGLTGRPVLLATLPGESHALGLQLVGLMIVSRGVPVRILGTGSPVAEIAESAAAFRAASVALSMTAPGISASTRRDVARLRSLLPHSTPLWLGGTGATLLRRLPDGVRVASSLDDTEELVAQARRRR